MMTSATQGNLADKSLGELICEIHETSGSGALRISRDRAKAVIYFENGAAVFAASNIRAHRLVEFLRRSGLADENSFADISAKATDDDVLADAIKQGQILPDQINIVRENHVTDIMRATLLWTEGHWQFDGKVRVTGENRVTLDTPRLLLESTRRLPVPYIAARLANHDQQIESVPQNGHSITLSPGEAFVLSRVTAPMSIKDLLALGGMPQDETLRAIFALSAAGLLKRKSSSFVSTTQTPEPDRIAKPETLEEFLARIDKAADYYQTLNVAPAATADEVKTAYHALARRYHPDRFHQADAALRSRIDSAFARVARAYEVLHDDGERSSYDERLRATVTASANALEHISATPATKPNAKLTGNEDRAEESFQKGLAALQQNQPQQALRFFAEAASIEPRRARYRAEYGRALINDPQTRRIAEIELKAAIALEPDNVSYRVALAELYKALGLRRRAEGELQRALTADPKNSVARKLLATLKN